MWKFREGIWSTIHWARQGAAPTLPDGAHIAAAEDLAVIQFKPNHRKKTASQLVPNRLHAAFVIMSALQKHTQRKTGAIPKKVPPPCASLRGPRPDGGHPHRVRRHLRHLLLPAAPHGRQPQLPPLQLRPGDPSDPPLVLGGGLMPASAGMLPADSGTTMVML